MIDLRHLENQEEMDFLFERTNFAEMKNPSFNAIKIYEPEEIDGEQHQFVWIGECEWMGTVTIGDFENKGEDALFIERIIQLYKEGRVKILDKPTEAARPELRKIPVE